MFSTRAMFPVIIFGLTVCEVWFTTATVRGDQYMGKVTANPGKIVEGEKTLAEVSAGTRLWVFSERQGWAEVKIPSREQYGWIKVDSLQKIVPKPAEQLLLDQAKVKHDEGVAAVKAQNYDAALAAFEASLALRRQTLDKKHLVLADTLIWVAIAARMRGDLQRASEASEESLAIRRETAGQEHTLVAESLRELARAQHELAKYGEARKNLELALAIQRRRLAADHPSIARSLQVYGLVLRYLADYSAAEQAFTEGVAICRKSKRQAELASCLNGLGITLKLQGDYSAARRCQEEALEISRAINGNEHTATAASLTNLGTIYFSLGDYPQAIKLHEEAHASYRQKLGEEHSNTLNVLQNIASARMALGELAAAEQIYQEILAKRRKFLAGDHPDLYFALRLLGNAKQALNKNDEAQACFTEALSIARKKYGDDHPNVIAALSQLGQIAAVAKNYAAARERYQEAISIQRGLPHKSNALATLLGYQARNSVRMNDLASARREYDEARRLEKKYLQQTLPTLSPAEQLLFLEKKFIFELFQSLSLGMLQPQETANVEFSADWLINGKAMAQDSLAVRELLARDSKDEQLGPLTLELQQVRQQLAGLALNAPAKNDATDKQQAEEVNRLNNRETRLVQQLAQASPDSASSGEWITHKKLRAALPAGAVYIDIMRMPLYDFRLLTNAKNHYWAWVFPAAGQGELQIFDLGDAEELENLLYHARANLAAAAGEKGLLQIDGEKAATQALRNDLQAVADKLLTPLAPALAGKQQLILSPDGSLWLLPWAALPIDGDKMLVEQFAIKFVTSGRDLLKNPIASTVGLAAPLIVVNPNYDLRGEAAAAAIKAVLPDTKVGGVSPRAFGGTSKIPRVKPLPNTAFEGQLAEPTLEELARRKPVVYAEDHALETLVKSSKRPKYLLIATHGFFLPDQKTTPAEKAESGENPQPSPAVTATGQVIENPLLRCGLLFAGCNAATTAGRDDGILTGLEIVGMDLRGTELVVLSACETGIGKVRNGEGVAGLRQAFQLAGARSVVSTLWQVPDRDSALVMQDFFKNLSAGQSKADALRNAQLKRIEARREKSGAAHPFFWAAWTVTE